MHVTKSKYTRGGGSHNIRLLTPTGRRAVDVRLVKIVYLCIHCLGRLKVHNSGVQCELNSTHYGYIHRDEAGQLTQEERFMKLSDMFPSDYLRGIDVGKPFIATIESISAEQTRDHKNNRTKTEWIMRFKEIPKKLRLNLTMVKECALFLEDANSPDEIDPEKWVGKQVTIYRTKTEGWGKEHIVPRIRKPERGDVDLAKAIKTAQPAKNGKEGPTFNDLLAKLSEDFGLDEATAKSLLKDELGYKTYSSTKFQEMYDSVKAIVPKGEPTEEEALLEAEQAAFFEEEALENGPGAAYDETGY